MKIIPGRMFLISLFLLIGGIKSQITQLTVYDLFNMVFEAAFGIDSNENAKRCAGICLPVQTAIFCPGVHDQVQCYTPNTMCCVRRGTPYELPKQKNQTRPHDLNKSGVNPKNSTNQHNTKKICPGYCMLNTTEETCESPAVVIPHTSDCGPDKICCDNSRIPVTSKPTKRPRPTTQPPTVSWSDLTDARRECPGICISNLVRFTCYGNAVITDLFKCKRTSTVCCAAKELVNETLLSIFQNEQIALEVLHSQVPTNSVHKKGETIQTDLNKGEELLCPGVCVQNKFITYCEAYVARNGGCDSDAKCCVSKETYSGKLADLRTPIWNNTSSIPLNTAQLIALINKTDATTKISKPIENDSKKNTVTNKTMSNTKTQHSNSSPDIDFIKKEETTEK